MMCHTPVLCLGLVTLAAVMCQRQPDGPVVATGGTAGTGGANTGGTMNSGGSLADAGVLDPDVDVDCPDADASVCPYVELPVPPNEEVVRLRKAPRPRWLGQRRHRHRGRARSVAYGELACPAWQDPPVRPLNQLNDGSCTGDTNVALLASHPIYDLSHYTQADALLAYQGGTCFDQNCVIPCSCESCPKAFCPATHRNDVGSYGSSVLQWMTDVLWLPKGYFAADTLDALRAGLSHSSCAIGVDFYYSMFQPDASGRLVMRKSSGLAGGHQMLGVFWDRDNDRVWVRTSWGNVWWCLASQLNEYTPEQGDGCGYAWIAMSDLVKLRFDADCPVL